MALRFDVIMDDSGFAATAEEVDKAFDEMQKKAEKMGQSLEEVSKDVKAQIEELKTAMYDQGAALKESTEAVDKLQEQYDKLGESLKNMESQQDTDVYKEMESQYNELGKELEEEKQKCDDLTKSFVEESKYLDVLVMADEKFTKEMKSQNSALSMLTGGQENFGKVISALPPQMRMVVDNFTGIVKAAKLFLATPIGLAIAAIAAALKAVMSYFKGTVEGEEQFAKVSGYVSGIIAKLKDILIEVGRAIVKVFTEPKESIKDFGTFLINQIVNRVNAVKMAFVGLGNIIQDVLRADFDKLKQDAAGFGDIFLQGLTGVENASEKLLDYGKTVNQVGKQMADLAYREQKLNEQRSEWATKKAELQTELNETMEHMYEGSYDSQMAAAKKAMDLNDQIATQEKKIAKEAWDIVKERNSLSSSNTADKDAENQAEAEYKQVAASAAAANKRLARTMVTLGKTIANGAVALNEAQTKASKDLRRAIEDSQFETDKAAIDAMNEGAEKQLAQRKLNHERTLVEIQREEEDQIQAARDAAKDAWSKDNKHSGEAWDEGFLSLTGNEKGLSDNDKKVIENYAQAVQTAKKNAETKTGSEDVSFFKVDDLISKYKDYDAKKRDIDERYKADRQRLDDSIAKYEADGDMKAAEYAANAKKQSYIDEEKERMALALEQLQADPAFMQAFEDMDAVATTTLDKLYTKLTELAPQLSHLPADQLKTITDLMQKITKTKLDRSITPFKDLKKAIQELHKAEESGNEDEIAKAQKKVNDTWEVASSEVSDLGKAISALGQEIQGEAGQYMILVGDTISFISTSISGVKKMAATGAQALSTIEKASVILAIVQAAIQVFKKLNEILNKFSDASEYEALVEKQKEYNKLADTVNEYTLAMIKAQQEEESWFGDDKMSNLKDLAEQNLQISTAYYDKLYQTQVKYRDKSKNDNNWTMFLDPTVGTINGVKTLTDSYDAQYTKAIDNLRIEIKSRKKSIMGFGGRNQETMDLREWAKENFEGAELFDADGWVNVELAQSIIDSYGDKLQGETKDTLEALIELKEQYDEYQESLKEYVSELYEPLVDNFVDSLWDWFDSGKDALTQFKNYASDVFRDIVTDMMKTIVLDKVVGNFEDDIKELYSQYSFKSIDEQTLLKKISLRTEDLMQNYEDSLPVLQNIMDSVSTILGESGIKIDTNASTGSATTSVSANVTQDSIDEANGRMTALQMGQQDQLQQQMLIAISAAQIVTNTGNANTILDDIRSMDAVRNTYLNDMYDRMGKIHSVISERLQNIDNNTKNI